MSTTSQQTGDIRLHEHSLRASSNGQLSRNRLIGRSCPGEDASRSSDIVVSGRDDGRLELKCSRSVIALAEIDPHRIEAEFDVVARAGMRGGGQGRVSAGRDIVAEFIEGVELLAGRDVLVGSRLTRCSVLAGRRIDASSAGICGGTIAARSVLDARELGNRDQASTRITVGFTNEMREMIRDLDAQMVALGDAIQMLSRATMALGASAAQLNLYQREQSSRLRQELSTCVRKMTALEHRRGMLHGSADAKEVLNVFETIYPGVTIAMGGYVFRSDHTMVGPLRIEMRSMNGTMKLVSIDERTCSVTVLDAVLAR